MIGEILKMLMSSKEAISSSKDFYDTWKLVEWGCHAWIGLKCRVKLREKYYSICWSNEVQLVVLDITIVLLLQNNREYWGILGLKVRNIGVWSDHVMLKNSKFLKI